MSGIIPFDFEEQAVRVVMRADEPWFVAADVCRVLEIGNPSDALSRLDDDECAMVNMNTLGNSEGIRGNPNARIISESGLYALVLTSRKEAARRFRKWITAEVLPAIRRTGRYELPQAPAPEARSFEEMTARDWLAMIREARILGGAPAGRRIWSLSPLPALNPGRIAAALDPAEGRACLDHLLALDVGGRAVADWLEDEGDDVALNRAGLRLLPHGLFVANNCAAFADTRWEGGAHRAALMAMPGVMRDETPRTLAGVASRGIVLPFALIAEASHV